MYGTCSHARKSSPVVSARARTSGVQCVVHVRKHHLISPFCPLPLCHRLTLRVWWPKLSIWTFHFQSRREASGLAISTTTDTECESLVNLSGAFIGSAVQYLKARRHVAEAQASRRTEYRRRCDSRSLPFRTTRGPSVDFHRPVLAVPVAQGVAEARRDRESRSQNTSLAQAEQPAVDHQGDAVRDGLRRRRREVCWEEG